MPCIVSFVGSTAAIGLLLTWTSSEQAA